MCMHSSRETREGTFARTHTHRLLLVHPVKTYIPNQNPRSQVGSEFVQKYLGEGPRMVRDVFRLARENSPSVVFIDEIDAIATKRFDAQTGADREVQRILLELLNQMDGFDQSTNVKVRTRTCRDRGLVRGWFIGCCFWASLTVKGLPGFHRAETWNIFPEVTKKNRPDRPDR